MVQAGLDGPLRHPQRGRDLRAGEPLPVAQDEHRPVALGRVPETERFISQSDGPEEYALRGAGCDEVQGWLAELPHNYRLVLTLRYFQELSYNEIAATIGEPVSTVRMRLFRARALFQKLAQQAQAREAQAWGALEHSAA